MIPMREESKVRATVLSMRVLLLAALAALLYAAPAVAQTPKVLVYHEATGTPHPSTAAGVTAIKAFAAANGFTADDTGDSAAFTAENLDQYAAVVFVSTTGDVMTPEEESAFQAYIQDGGGFVGIHDAARVETGNAWFTSLIGSRPNSGSPTATQQAIVEVQDKAHPATKGLATEWQRTDEWFNWQPSPAGNVHVVANLRELSYANKGTGANGWEHPISWCRDYDGGRSFYTGMGHTAASYAEAEFRKHLAGAHPVGRRPRARRLQGDDRRQLHRRAADRAERLPGHHGRDAARPDRRAARPGDRQRTAASSTSAARRAASCAPITNWTDTERVPRLGHGARLGPVQAGRRRVKLAGTLDVFGDPAAATS